MERKIRVGIIAYDLSALRGGTKVSLQIGAELVEAGFEVAYACVFYDEKLIKTKLMDTNFKVYSAKKTFLGKKLVNMSVLWNQAGPALQMCREFKPDIVIESCGIVSSAFVPMLLGIPTISYCHYPASAYTADYNNKLPVYKTAYLRVLKLIELAFAKRFKKIFTNSDYAKAVIKRHWGLDAHTLYPPIDEKLFKPGKKDNLILCVVFYNEYYQLDKLAEEFKKINLGDYELVVVGPTHEQHKTRALDYYAQLKSKFSDKNIHWLANIDFTELASLYGRAKFFWFPGTTYLGLIIMEAQSAGDVVLYYGMDGKSELIINEKTGFLVNDLEGMAKKTKVLIANPQAIERMGLAARENAKRFSRENFRKNLVSAIDAVLKR